jgi:DNA helicase HerA-like ATPase
MEHTYLGTAFSGQAHSLTLDQRLRHIAVNGKTGYGKSTLLKSVLAQDIARGDGVLLLDPAGTLAEEALAFIPPSRNNHVCYFNIADSNFPVGSTSLPTCRRSAALHDHLD